MALMTDTLLVLGHYKYAMVQSQYRAFMPVDIEKSGGLLKTHSQTGKYSRVKIGKIYT